jgi:intracellular septation protein A
LKLLLDDAEMRKLTGAVLLVGALFVLALMNSVVTKMFSGDVWGIAIWEATFQYFGWPAVAVCYVTALSGIYLLLTSGRKEE